MDLGLPFAQCSIVLVVFIKASVLTTNKMGNLMQVTVQLQVAATYMSSDAKF